MRPLLAWLSGDPTDTSPAAAEAVRVAEEVGNPSSLMLALEAQALTHLTAGQPDDAAAACKRALTVARGEAERSLRGGFGACTPRPGSLRGR